MTTMPSTPPAGAPTLPQVGDRYTEDDAWVEVYARSQLPSRFGDFQIFVFRSSFDDPEHLKENLAVVRGDLHDRDDVLVRLHSECLTGDVLGSLRCDCRAQLEKALTALGHESDGVLLYLRQEGRGIGLGNKVRAYALQERGLDTFEANRHLGFDDDLRDYREAAMILKALQLRRIRLATNNPRKVFGLKTNGIEVSGRVPLVTEPTPYNADYLAAKSKSGHFLPFE